MKNSSAVKYHMFFNVMYQIKNPAQKNVLTTRFLWTTRLETKNLLSENSPTYVSKLSEPGVIEVVNQNYSLAEPFATIVDNAFLRKSCGIDINMDPYGQQENYEVTENSWFFR